MKNKVRWAFIAAVVVIALASSSLSQHAKECPTCGNPIPSCPPNAINCLGDPGATRPQPTPTPTPSPTPTN